MRIDFTLTLPGMFEIENIVNLAEETDTDILAKVIFSFSPDIVLSPLALPKPLLLDWIDDIINRVGHRSIANPLIEVLSQLDSRPTFQEQWYDSWEEGLIKGKRRIEQLEKIRKDSLTLEQILSKRKDVYDWWKSIKS
jgi:hypothetical protein